MAAAGGLAPPSTDSKSAVLLLDDTAIKWSGRRDSHPRSLAPEASVFAATLRPDGRRPGSRTRPSCMSGRRGHWLTRRRKLAAEIGFAPISFALTGRGTTCCATRQWWAGTDSHRDLLCVGEGSLLLDDPPEKNGATDGCCPRYLLLDRQATLLVCPRSHGQVAGICTRFSGFTGRCPAHWATHLIKWSERRDSHSRDLGPKPSA